MHTLIIAAHGSRRQASNDEVQALSARIRETAAAGTFARVETAFLELAEPSIPAMLETCIRDGATAVTLVPYFLAGGRHVVEDIPGIVAKVAKHHPEVRIRIAPHIGVSPVMPDLVLATATG